MGMARKMLIATVAACATAYAAQWKEVEFLKVCKRCGQVSHEVQLYAWNELTQSWQKSWRSDTNRPGCCEECYFALQPKIRWFSKPMNAYTIGKYDTTSSCEDNSNYKMKWWNNGTIEKLAYSKPIGIGWKYGRLNGR